RLVRAPRVEAEVREHPLPGLQRPARAVRSRAGGEEPRQLRARVAPADVLDRLEVARLVERLPAARVVDLEGQLRLSLRRRQGVDGPPDEHVLLHSAGGVGDERVTTGVDLELRALRIPVDEITWEGGRRGEAGGRGYEG